MTRIFVRAIGVFGRRTSMADKYDDNLPEGPTDFDVTRSYEQIQKVLQTRGRKVKAQTVNPLPYLDDGIITGPSAASSYAYKNCLIANLLVPGNGFNSDGTIQTMLAAGAREQDVKQTLEELKNFAHYNCLNYWRENPKLSKEVEVDWSSGTDLDTLVAKEPKLLSMG